MTKAMTDRLDRLAETLGDDEAIAEAACFLLTLADPSRETIEAFLRDMSVAWCHELFTRMA